MKVELPKSMEDVESGGNFEPLPPATYTLEVDNIDVKTSKASNQPYMSMTYKVVDDDEFAGRKIFDNLSLSENALWKFKDFSLAVGVDVGKEFDTEEFLGLDFQAVVDLKKGDQIPNTDPPEFYPDKNEVKSYVVQK
jgi:hypothetical protein